MTGCERSRNVARDNNSLNVACVSATTTTASPVTAPAYPGWQVTRDQSSIGASQYIGPRTIQQCLDYCNNNTNCVAVDIDVNVVPLVCWTHFSFDDLTAVNTFYQPGTNQYRLVTRYTTNATGTNKRFQLIPKSNKINELVIICVPRFIVPVKQSNLLDSESGTLVPYPTYLTVIHLQKKMSQLVSYCFAFSKGMCGTLLPIQST